MDIKHLDSSIEFLSGGGEMGELTRAKDWSKTVLGSPQFWPQSLKTTLSIILNSKFPMFLWWGPELICFYNDAYRPSLGQNGKHPDILGMYAEDAWTEIWTIIKPLIDTVIEKGESTWSEDQLIPIYRNRKIEDVYWTFSYSPVYNEEGKRAGVLVTCFETTDKVLTLQKLEDSKNELEFAIEATELGTWDYNPVTNKFSSNHRLKEWFGLPVNAEIELQHAIDAIDEKDKERVRQTIYKSLEYSSGGLYDIEYNINNPLTKKQISVHAKGRAWFDDNGKPYRFNGTLEDVTEQTIAKNKIAQTVTELKLFKFIVDNVSDFVGICDMNFIPFYVNSEGLQIVGLDSLEQLKNTPVREFFFPEDVDFILNTFFPSVLRKGTGETEIRFRNFKTGEAIWMIYNVLVVRDSEGNPAGLATMSKNITAQKISEENLWNALKEIEKNREKLNIVIAASDLATWELDLITSEVHYSERYLEILGYPKDTELSHAQIIKHIHPDDLVIRQKAFEEAYQNGTLHYEGRIIWNDQSIHWIEGRGKLFYDPEGNPHRMLGTVRDITEEKTYRQLLEEREQKFRLLADSMPQHIWTCDTEGKLNYCNLSLINYSGQSIEQLIASGMISVLHPDDREESIQAWHTAIESGKDFIIEHRFVKHTGEYRWQFSRAIPQRDANGNIQMWVGTSTDIHDQKNFTSELENQVRQRTKELEMKNVDLEKMNKELQSFAYISSHDLQEPLRKIQTFAARIVENEERSLSDRGKDYFKRMQIAANRMQTLIDDLLAYSRANTDNRNYELTDLNKIVSQVRIDLAEELQHTNAVIETSKLCELNIIPFQFLQLMHNLVSNSLKFSDPGRTPRILIESRIGLASDFNEEFLFDNVVYCRITVADNGIGFEPKYKEKIFELFQRLHGRSEYKGTGIGLAIVKKIVENHNGFITATGEVDKGATFTIYIPVSN